MKIGEAKKIYSAQLERLLNQKQTLSERLESGGDNGIMPNVDRLELSRELSEVEAEYAATKEAMDGILAAETAVYNGEVARQQGEAAAKAAEDLGKIMEIYRRIASGGVVPPKDERKLMEYSSELYMAAKAAAMMAQGESEEYDSLWQDEKAEAEENDPAEMAAETEIAVPAPEAAAAAAAAESGQEG